MTNEQVITRIKHNSMYKDDRETADYIIKALEQQPSEDCVSRQAVLDILSHYAHNFGADTEIKAMLPVTPTHGTCKDCKYAEIHNGKLSEHCSVKCEPFCRKFLRFVSGEDFYCADFEKRGNSDGSN